MCRASFAKLPMVATRGLCPLAAKRSTANGACRHRCVRHKRGSTSGCASKTRLLVDHGADENLQNMTELQTKRPQLVTSDDWKTLIARLRLAMQNTNQKSIQQVCAKHKQMIMASAIRASHRTPMMARPECSSETIAAGTDERSKPKLMAISWAVIH